MSPWTARHLRARAAVVAVALLTAACGNGLFTPEFEYEEDLYPALDGSATLYINTSLAALKALRGLEVPSDPQAYVDRTAIRRMFEAPGVTVGTPTLSRRDGRRFVHLRIEVTQLADLVRVGPLAWSTYEWRSEGDLVSFRHQLGPSVNRQVGDVGWKGRELVAYRVHPPSRITFHAPPEAIARGNILTWQQPLQARLAGAPLDLQVRMEASSILARTLLLFGGTILAAAAAFAAVIWFVARRGRSARQA